MSCHFTNQKELNLEVDAVGTGWLTQCSPGGGEAWQKIHARSEKKKKLRKSNTKITDKKHDISALLFYF